MWPKLLLELLPHFARIMPIADKYFSSRSASDKAQQEAMAALAADLKSGLAQAAVARADLDRQLHQQIQDQGSQIAQAAVEVTRVRLGVESLEARITKLEKTATTTLRLAIAAVALMAVVLTLFIIRIAR